MSKSYPGSFRTTYTPPAGAMPEYPYLRAWARYHGADYWETEGLVARARTDRAPLDAYVYWPGERRWGTLGELTMLARHNVVASDHLLKIYEYVASD